jgi:hypothetical protein
MHRAYDAQSGFCGSLHDRWKIGIADETVDETGGGSLTSLHPDAVFIHRATASKASHLSSLA